MQQEGERIMEIRKITGIVPADKRAVETAFAVHIVRDNQLTH
jgi:hypothetical protein